MLCLKKLISISTLLQTSVSTVGKVLFCCIIVSWSGLLSTVIDCFDHNGYFSSLKLITSDCKANLPPRIRPAYPSDNVATSLGFLPIVFLVVTFRNHFCMHQSPFLWTASLYNGCIHADEYDSINLPVRTWHKMLEAEPNVWLNADPFWI